MLDTQLASRSSLCPFNLNQFQQWCSLLNRACTSKPSRRCSMSWKVGLAVRPHKLQHTCGIQEALNDRCLHADSDSGWQLKSPDDEENSEDEEVAGQADILPGL